MDKRKLLLLKYLSNNCNDTYKILDTQKVMKVIKKYKNNFQNFEYDIEYLKQRKYIDLKYIDESNLCLSILDNSRILQENLRIENHSKKEFISILLFSGLFSGFMAFIGSFLAIILIR